ncbi:hypothetical protein ACQ33O_12090 [Ferruginibacter sp. SUN002]|uniref:hypothetical protein n=1 Tax=Ferruginibacter sp. SUN002 TaxID=2937789 RepID=UPI003D36D66D
MHNTLIAASLFHNKTCTLPGIGTLSVHTNVAESDFVNTQLLAPTYAIQFSPAVEDANVFNEFSAISELLKSEIDRLGRVEMNGIGTFEKVDDKIIFSGASLSNDFTLPVKAERVIRQHTEHTMLVGDKETTNVVMTEYFTETVVKKRYWWVWAIVLAAIGITGIVYHFYRHGYTLGISHVLGAE